jgi:hypothetical protein
MSTLPDYEPELYAYLESVESPRVPERPAANADANSWTLEPPLSEPDPLQLWASYCEQEGLIQYTPWLDGAVLELTDLGRLALRVWRRGKAEIKQELKQPEDPPDDALTHTSDRAGMAWQEAAERMERLRRQGEPYTSQHKLAEQFGCSSWTINKAIKETPPVQVWAKRSGAAPRAQSINDAVTDRTAQSREPDPEDDAAIREYLERDNLTPEERAFFNGLSREDQLFYLNDPDKHQKILGRKP